MAGLYIFIWSVFIIYPISGETTPFRNEKDDLDEELRFSDMLRDDEVQKHGDTGSNMSQNMPNQSSEKQTFSALSQVKLKHLMEERFNELLQSDDDASLNREMNIINKMMRQRSTQKEPVLQEQEIKTTTNDYINGQNNRIIEKLWKKSVEVVSDRVAADHEHADLCRDSRTDCGILKLFCKTHRHELESVCAKTCGYCDQKRWICVDKIFSCKWLRSFGKCATDIRMHDFCPKTCLFCRVPSPPKCSQTRFGCCWDTETIKANEHGSNCPRCLDEYHYICKTFAVDCEAHNDAGKFMRQNCPRTCNLCSGGACIDQPQAAFYCPFWKQDLDWCDKEKENMRHFCPKTCGLC